MGCTPGTAAVTTFFHPQKNDTTFFYIPKKVTTFFFHLQKHIRSTVLKWVADYCYVGGVQRAWPTLTGASLALVRSAGFAFTKYAEPSSSSHWVTDRGTYGLTIPSILYWARYLIKSSFLSNRSYPGTGTSCSRIVIEKKFSYESWRNIITPCTKISTPTPSR